MNKIKNLLVGLLILFAAPLLVACNNDDDLPINWDDRIYVSYILLDDESKTIPLPNGSEYTLKYTVMPQEANNKTVKFTTSNPNVATVDNNGVVTAVGAGSCNITIISQDNASALSAVAVVNVVSSKETLATPTNIRYDGTRLTWDAVKANSSESFAPKYELTISRDGEMLGKFATTATYYTDLPEGEYTVNLRALGDEGNVLYNDSMISADFHFAKIGKPNDLQITAVGDVESLEPRTYELSFSLLKNTDSIDDYEARITPVTGTTLPSVQQELWDAAIADAEIREDKLVVQVPSNIMNDPVYVVFRAKESVTENIYGSGYGNVVQVGKLTVPTNLRISSYNSESNFSKVLSWDSVVYADKYLIRIDCKNEENVITNTLVQVIDAYGTTSYDLTQIDNYDLIETSDNYDVYLYALGTSQTSFVYMDSGSSVCAKKQLSAISGEIMISPNNTDNTYTISWNKVNNAIGYKVYISSNAEDYLTSSDTLFYDVMGEDNTKITLSYDQTNSINNAPIWNVGNNYIKIVAQADINSNFENSAVRKAEQVLIKLATPNLRVSKGELVWDAIPDAEKYTLVFTSGQIHEIETVPNKVSYNYEPESADFTNGRSGEVYIYVSDDNSDYVIKSQNSDKIAISKYGTVSTECLSVADGNLSWRNSDGQTVDTEGNTISTDSVEVRIMRTDGEQVLKTVSAGGGSLNLTNALADVDGDGFYSFSVRAINTNTSGTYDINGDWSDTIKTYQMKAPQNLRVVDGVLTWDPYVDDNVGRYNAAIRYVIKIGEAVLTDDYDINTTSTVISNLTGNTNYSISIQTKVVSSRVSEGGSITVQGSPDTYLINSEFSEPKRVKMLARPLGLDIRGYTLSWTASSTSINRYTVSLYKAGESVPIATEANVVPLDRYNPSLDFSDSVFSDSLVLAGNYQFVVQAWGDDDSSLTSYPSDGIEICKLESPVITVGDNGIISWTNSYATLNGIISRINQFNVTVTNTRTGQSISFVTSDTSTTLSELSLRGEDIWCGIENPISIKIQALNDNINKVYSSNVTTYERNTGTSADPEDSTVTIYKLPKLDTSAFEITSSAIKWTSGTYNNSASSYNIMICQKSAVAKDQILVQTTVDASTDGGYYNISQNWTGGDYYVKVQQVGYQNNLDNSITRYLSSEYSDAVSFSRFSEPAGVYMSADEDDKPVLNWNVTTENENSMYQITLQKFLDGVKTVELIYQVPYNQELGGKYSLNLFNAEPLENEGNITNIQDIDEGNYFGEYQIYINTVRKLDESGKPIDSIIKDGVNYLLMESRISKRQSMVIYTAPTINVVGNSIKINNSNSSSKGVDLVFSELTLSGSELTLNPTGRVFTAELSATDEYYEIDESEMEPGVWYQVTTMARGNSANLVSSPTVLSDVVVTKLAQLTPNTVSAILDPSGYATNVTSFDGWYVRDGQVAWNDVNGASGYRIYLTGQNATKLVVDRVADSTAYSEVLSDLSFANNYGAFQMQFEIVGGETTRGGTFTRDGKQVTTGYLSSNLSAPVWVNKLYAPNRDFGEVELKYQVYTSAGIPRDVTVNRTGAYSRIAENGEFDFGLRDSGDTGKWIDTSGATQYMLSIQSKEAMQTIYYDLEEENYFYASEYWKGADSAGEYIVTIYSIGNNWYGANDSNNEIFLTSDAYGTFKLLYTGVIDDLGVENGNLVWATNVKNTINKYDLKYKYGTVTETIALTDKTYNFSDNNDVKGEIIDEIYVRFAGNPTKAGALEGYVNTAWNEIPLTRVSKLADIGTKDNTDRYLYINNLGQLAWNMGDELTALDQEEQLYFNITRVVRLGDVVVQPAASETVLLRQQVYSVPRVADTGQTDLTYIYDMSAYVAGTVPRVDANANRVSDGEDASILYLNSNTYNFSAGKLNTPADGTFKYDTINGGVRISWDLTGCSINISSSEDDIGIVEGDQLLITYTMNNGETTEMKFVDAKAYQDDDLSVDGKIIGGMPLWQLGTYTNMSMVVLNSEGLAFGSSAINLDASRIEFNFFESGTGTRNDPFVITTVEQFTNSFWLPEMYFKLNNDLRLPDLSELQLTYSDANNNVPYPARFYDENSGVTFKYRDLSLEGGFDGNGKKITNYQEKRSSSTYIWSSLFGSYKEPITLENGQIFDDTVFGNMGGVITNLTIEVNTLDVGSVIGMYNGIFVGSNYGVISNCNLTGDDNKLNEAGNRQPVVEGYFTEASGTNGQYYFGGFAGLVGSQRVISGQIGQGDDAILLYEKVFVGRIENCTNTLDLEIENQNKNSTVMVGGIAGLNNGGYIVDCVNGIRNADSQQNKGNVKGYWSGGIVGANSGASFREPADNSQGYVDVKYYSYISGCINYGQVSSKCIAESSQVASVSGGIAGLVSEGYVTNCINHGTVNTDGVAALLGGIAGVVMNGSYLLNLMNTGYIEYNKYTDVTEQTMTRGATGAIVCTASGGVLKNFAVSTGCCRVLYNGAVDSVNSNIYAGEPGGAIVGSSTIYIGDLTDGTKKDSVLNTSNINTSSTSVDSTTIYTSYVNGAGLAPMFDFEDGEWTIKWTTATPDSIDPTEINNNDDVADGQ